MNPYTPEFLLLVFTVAAVFFALPGAPARRLLFASISVGFLSTYLPNTMSWLVLLAFLLSGYGCAMLLRRWPRPIFLTTYLILLVAAFAILKRYDFVRWFVPDGILGLPVAIVGLSYMLFRQIHFVVDAMQGQIDRPSLWAYLNYQLNPFGLLAGPIQRFQDFGEYWAHPSPLHRTRHGVLKTYMRLFVGIIKVVLISGALLVLHNRSLDHLDGEAASGGGWRSAAWLALACYSFMFYLYMNFSGYCDFAIAGASLVGLGLPENFQAPFLARNILDYWSRWHITLGHWIRDYLFTPIYKAGVERWPSGATTVALIAYFVAFTLAGIWHGSTWNFLVYGLLHGVGASAAKLWETTIVRYAGRPGLKRYLKSAAIRRVAIVGTFHYACFTLLFFAMDLDRARRILARVASGLLSAY